MLELPASVSRFQRERWTHGLTSLGLASTGRIGQILAPILAVPPISWVTLCTLLISSSLSFFACKVGIMTIPTHSVVGT